MKKIIACNIFTFLAVLPFFAQDSGNMWFYDYGSSTFNAQINQVVLGNLTENATNPNTSNANSNSNVAKFIKKEGVYSFIRFDLNEHIISFDNLKFKIKIYLENSTIIPNNYITLILRKDRAGATQIAVRNTIQTSEQWIEYTFDFSGAIMKEDYYNQIQLFFAIPDTDFNATGFTYYFDAFQGPQLPQTFNAKKELVSVFPDDGASQTATTGFSFSKNYLPSGSTWSIPWEETHVYNSLLKYEHPTNPDQSYELRIGKGGQIYSFKGSFGESVPPQYKNPTADFGPDSAPWVDEVWQLVAVDSQLNDPENDQKYFIHQAGVYLKDPENLSAPFYSPQIASYYNEEKQEYTIVNWGQHAHIGDNLNAGFTSSLLYYTKFKNIGNGIIQVDYLIYNFGEDTINYLNIPWGGVRTSTLDYTFVSNPDNSYNEFIGHWTDGFYNLSETNGWVAFSNGGSTGNGASLGLLTNNTEGRLRIGDTNLADGDARDYTVYEGSKVNVGLTFGKSIRIRNYYILDSSVENIKNQVANSELQSKSFYGVHAKLESEVRTRNYYFEEVENKLNAALTNNSNGLALKLQPYENSYPLFIVKGTDENSESVSRITTNLYSFSHLPYDGKQQNIQLIGFSNTKKQISLETVEICAGDNFTFPDGTTLTDIKTKTIHLSNMGTDGTGYTNYIQTTLSIDDNDPCQLGLASPNEAAFKIYPNPTNNQIHITGASLKKNDAISLANTIGLEVSSKASIVSKTNEKIVLDLGELPTGIYFLSIGNTKSQLIIKK